MLAVPAKRGSASETGNPWEKTTSAVVSRATIGLLAQGVN
jgi:hypothetical protein